MLGMDIDNDKNNDTSNDLETLGSEEDENTSLLIRDGNRQRIQGDNDAPPIAGIKRNSRYVP